MNENSLKRDHFKRKGLSSNYHFSGDICLFSGEYIGRSFEDVFPILKMFFFHCHVSFRRCTISFFFNKK